MRVERTLVERRGLAHRLGPRAALERRGAPDRIDASRPALLAQEFGGGRRTSADGSNQSGLGLGRRTARPGALRARTPAQNRRAATHAARPRARLPQNL